MNKLTTLILVVLTTSFVWTYESSPILDNRDGNKYQTIQLGKMIVMAENLAFDTEGSSCFNNEDQSCAHYGRLYDCKTVFGEEVVERAQGICPDGWHIPSAKEWKYLMGGLSGKMGLKNNTLFSVFQKNLLQLHLGGFRSAHNDQFYMRGQSGQFMSSSTKDGSWVIAEVKRKGNGYELSLHNKFSKERAVSCRCVKD